MTAKDQSLILLQVNWWVVYCFNDWLGYKIAKWFSISFASLLIHLRCKAAITPHFQYL